MYNQVNKLSDVISQYANLAAIALIETYCIGGKHLQSIALG